jgi:hypothetical protein
MAKRLDIVLHCDFSRGDCLSKIEEQIDLDTWTLFSFSGYRGVNLILGRVAGNEFRLHKRRYWHNSFGPVFFGRAMTERHGCRIEGYWDTWRLSHIFIRCWIILAMMFAIPMLAASVRELMNKKSLFQDNIWLGIVVPLGLILWGFLLPWLGAALSFHERKHVVLFLERVLLARQVAEPRVLREWKTSLNAWAG